MEQQSPDTTTEEVPKSLGMEREGQGEGFTPEEALQNWFDTDPQFIAENKEGDTDERRFGNQALDKSKQIRMACMREPYIPKRCATKIIKQEGSRKWETKHVIYRTEDDECCGDGDTKQEAVKKARELALANDVEYRIEVEKKLVEGNAVEAIITPKVKRPGRWKFKASFLY